MLLLFDAIIAKDVAAICVVCNYNAVVLVVCVVIIVYRVADVI